MNSIGNFNVNIRLVEQLQALKEEDLFPQASPDDIAGRKVEVEKRRVEQQRVARAKVEKLCEEDDIPFNILKELHEDNLAPNHAVNFSVEQWKEILVNFEVENLGSLEHLQDLEHDIQGVI